MRVWRVMCLSYMGGFAVAFGGSCTASVLRAVFDTEKKSLHGHAARLLSSFLSALSLKNFIFLLHALGELDSVVIVKARQVTDTLTVKIVLNHLDSIRVDNFIKNLTDGIDKLANNTWEVNVRQPQKYERAAPPRASCCPRRDPGKRNPHMSGSSSGLLAVPSSPGAQLRLPIA